MCLAKITFKVTAVIGERPSSRIKGKKEKKEAGGGLGRGQMLCIRITSAPLIGSVLPLTPSGILLCL